MYARRQKHTETRIPINKNHCCISFPFFYSSDYWVNYKMQLAHSHQPRRRDLIHLFSTHHIRTYTVSDGGGERERESEREGCWIAVESEGGRERERERERERGGGRWRERREHSASGDREDY